MRRVFMMISLLALTALPAFAANTWQQQGRVVTGGASQLSGGGFRLNGAIELVGGGRMAGGGYDLTSGFFLAASPTPIPIPTWTATAQAEVTPLANATPEPTATRVPEAKPDFPLYLPLIQADGSGGADPNYLFPFDRAVTP